MKIITHSNPYLLSLFAGLVLFANNLDWIKPIEIIRSLTVALIITLILHVALMQLISEKTRATIFTSLILLLFYSYGHVKEFAREISIGTLVIGQTIILIPMWVSLFAIGTFYILKRVNNSQEFNKTITVVGIILLIFPITSILNYYGQFNRNLTANINEIKNIAFSQSGLIEGVNSNTDLAQMPNIYYIILDAYSREDILEEYYDYDNSWFIQGLEQRGFYVAGQSRANYLRTLLSLTSSLNLIHVEETVNKVFESPSDKDTAELLMDNFVIDFLQDQGYTVVVTESGYEHTRITDADIWLSPSQSKQSMGFRDVMLTSRMNRFERMFVDTTLARIIFSFQGEFPDLQDFFTASLDKPKSEGKNTREDNKREKIIFALDHISDYSKSNSPHFIFVHILAPHQPYVFGPDGEEVYIGKSYTLSDVKLTREEKIPYYRDQVNYLNTLVLDSIDTILKESKTPPIIIIQGDHGDKSYFEISNQDYDGVNTVSAILNAYYFPNDQYDQLYPWITPVNTFRIIFNQYFSTNFKLLPDTSYVERAANTRYDFIDICVAHSICSPDIK